MAFFERGEISLHYEIHGDGFPLLLFAPGGLRSAIPFWRSAEWDPIEALSPHFEACTPDWRRACPGFAPERPARGYNREVVTTGDQR